MKKEITIGTGFVLPCLHCGEMIDMNADDIHFCNKPKNEWLNKQDKALILLSKDKAFDMKSKKIINRGENG